MQNLAQYCYYDISKMHLAMLSKITIFSTQTSDGDNAWLGKKLTLRDETFFCILISKSFYWYSENNHQIAIFHVK